MSAVVDASVLVAAVADSGPEGRWAEAVVAQPPLAAPALVHAEASNILRRLELLDRLTRLEATSAQQDLLNLDIEIFPYQPLAARAWELRHNLTCYDAWYVAVAEALDWPMATLDGRLTRAAGPNCRFLTPT